MADNAAFICFNRTPYKLYLYLLLSINNQVINDIMKPRNNPSHAELWKIPLFHHIVLEELESSFMAISRGFITKGRFNQGFINYSNT